MIEVDEIVLGVGQRLRMLLVTGTVNLGRHGGPEGKTRAGVIDME